MDRAGLNNEPLEFSLRGDHSRGNMRGAKRPREDDLFGRDVRERGHRFDTWDDLPLDFNHPSDLDPIDVRRGRRDYDPPMDCPRDILDPPRFDNRDIGPIERGPVDPGLREHVPIDRGPIEREPRPLLGMGVGPVDIDNRRDLEFERGPLRDEPRLDIKMTLPGYPTPSMSHNMMGYQDPAAIEPSMMNQSSQVIVGEGYELFPSGRGHTLSEKPPNCKTIYVGGLPLNAQRNVVSEIFERIAGPIESYRGVTPRYCHIRFYNHLSVDAAVTVSGYILRLNNSDNRDDNGVLRVDYSKCKEDEHEFECAQRRVARQMRHMQQEDFRPDSPPTSLTRFSILEADHLTETIKDVNKFVESSRVLVSWLERGECNKKTSSVFYRLIQLTHSHVRRLVSEKEAAENGLTVAQEIYNNALSGLSMQINLIDQVFSSATKQRAWDHFTKAQRKSINLWKTQAQEVKIVQQKEMGMESKGEADMDVSDDEDSRVSHRVDDSDDDVIEIIEMTDPEPQPAAANKPKPAEAETVSMSEPQMVSSQSTPSEEAAPSTSAVPTADVKPSQSESKGKPEQTKALEGGTSVHEEEEADTEDVEKLKMENKTMKMQLEAFRNEVDVMKGDEAKTKEENETKIKALQHALVSMQQQLTETKSRLKREEELRKELETESERSIDSNGKTSSKTKDRGDRLEGRRDQGVLDDSEAALLGFLSIFLHAHPFGASIEYLCSYVSCLQPRTSTSDIETLMKKYPKTFIQEVTGVGASIEKRWKFAAYDSYSKV